MKITRVKIRKIFDSGEMNRIRAIVSVTFDDEFAVHDLKIVQGIERLFVAMPNRQFEDGRFQDIAHPTCTIMRKRMEEEILSEYAKALAEVQEVESKNQVNRDGNSNASDPI